MSLSALRPSPTARALLLVSLSLLVWGRWALTHRYIPIFGGLSGHYSDHTSHMNAARLFTWCGSCLWRQPVDQFLPRYTLEQRQYLPEDLGPYMRPGSDIFVLPGWALDKPLLLNWPFLPRPYPPGTLVLAAPVALAYHYTSLSFANANRLLYLSYLLYAHIGFFLLLRVMRPEGSRLPALGLLGGALLYSEIIHWAIDGFYDVALIAPFALCGHYLRQRRGLAALVCYCAAAFIHYRAYFFAPLSLYALYLVVREWKQQPWGARQWGALAAIIVLGGASLSTFWILSPWLSRFPLTNVLRFDSGSIRLHLLVASGLALGALLYARAWMDVVLLGWMAGMLSRVYQTMPWHVLSLMMWLVLPIWTVRDERVSLVRDVRLALLWLVSMLVYANTLLPSAWLERLP